MSYLIKSRYKLYQYKLYCNQYNLYQYNLQKLVRNSRKIPNFRIFPPYLFFGKYGNFPSFILIQTILMKTGNENFSISRTFLKAPTFLTQNFSILVLAYFASRHFIKKLHTRSKSYFRGVTGYLEIFRIITGLLSELHPDTCVFSVTAASGLG